MPEKTSLRVEVLGPLRAYRGPIRVELGPTKQRAMFAALALHADRAVPVDSLLELVWGKAQPASARQLVHTYVARLRRLLEPEMPPRHRGHVIGSAPGGYLLMMDGGCFDVTRFRLLWRQAQRYLGTGETARAFELLGEGLRWWRDPALSELSLLLSGTEAVDSLRRDWRDVALDYVATGLELGEAPAVVTVAHQLAVAEPMHEVAQARYLKVLEQTGQRAAAIEHFNDVRVMLSEELGVGPGPHLSGAYRSLLGATPQPPPQRSSTVGGYRPPRPPWRGPRPALGELIHREEDLGAMTRILAEQRLLTVTGAPGCGKSVLALHTAARLRDDFLGGITVLECSQIADAARLTGALAQLLGGTPGVDAAAKLLGDQQGLLVLDNVEHLLDPCAAVVDEVVRACEQVSVVVTSREPLGLPYETVWRVGPLAAGGGEPGWVGDWPAVRLFARRAVQVCPGFRLAPDNAQTIAALCERLDNLPLAVELAAACLATETLDVLVSRLDNPLRELRPPRRGSPVHQRSLWAALQRSLDCLSAVERWCFLRLGQLPRCFPPAVAQEAWRPAPWGPVDGRAMLTSLVDKSLLCVDHDRGGPRYHMLGLLHRFGAELCAEERAA